MIKRIVNGSYLYSYEIPSLIYSSNNQFCSVTMSKIIMNHHPLELMFYRLHQSRLSIRETVRKIGKGVFFNNQSITYVVFAASVEIIDDYAFGSCENLTSIRFKRNSRLITIGAYAFSETSIKSVDIPASVEEIGEGAFKTISVSDPNRGKTLFPPDSKLKRIGRTAFCDSMICSIDIPASVEFIGAFAFRGKLLVSVTFARDSIIKKIGRCSFCQTSISEVTIPASVEVIKHGAFSDCPLRNVTFAKESNLKKIGKNSFSNTNIKEIEIPESVEVIRSKAFEHCLSLESITFAKHIKLKRIEKFTFHLTKIEKIEIPSVEIIENALKDVTFAKKTRLVFVEKNAFRNCEHLLDLKLPILSMILNNFINSF